jgi:SAM-dependent methyltransferase
MTAGSGPTLEPERQVRYAWAARLLAGSRVLDAGCGTGSGTALLAGCAREAIGVDTSPLAIDDARRLHARPRLQFRQADMRDLPFDEAEFEAVVCFEALSQVSDPELALDELARVLGAGGLLLVSVPNRERYPPGNPLHLSEMSSAELERSLATRFASVVVYRQQTYHASLLSTAATLAHDDPNVRIDLEARKTWGEPPGSELYAVAAASDGRLPAEPAEMALGRSIDLVDQQRRLQDLEQRCVKAEAEVVALRDALHLERKGD